MTSSCAREDKYGARESAEFATTSHGTSVIPFHLDADAAVGIGADVAFDLGVVEHLDLDYAAARVASRTLPRADIDAGRDILAGFDRHRRVAGVGIGRAVARAQP